MVHLLEKCMSKGGSLAVRFISLEMALKNSQQQAAFTTVCLPSDYHHHRSHSHITHFWRFLILAAPLHSSGRVMVHFPWGRYSIVEHMSWFTGLATGND